MIAHKGLRNHKETITHKGLRDCTEEGPRSGGTNSFRRRRCAYAQEPAAARYYTMLIIDLDMVAC